MNDVYETKLRNCQEAIQSSLLPAMLNEQAFKDFVTLVVGQLVINRGMDFNNAFQIAIKMVDDEYDGERTPPDYETVPSPSKHPKHPSPSWKWKYGTPLKVICPNCKGKNLYRSVINNTVLTMPPVYYINHICEDCETEFIVKSYDCVIPTAVVIGSDRVGYISDGVGMETIDLVKRK